MSRKSTRLIPGASLALLLALLLPATGLSQTPGVPGAKPLVAGAPGHGEGHNSGMPMMIVAAIAAKSDWE